VDLISYFPPLSIHRTVWGLLSPGRTHFVTRGSSHVPARWQLVLQRHQKREGTLVSAALRSNSLSTGPESTPPELLVLPSHGSCVSGEAGGDDLVR
jgi:hypothetical protein